MPAPAPRRLWPNIGAEEGQASRFADQPAVAATRTLWTGLFDDPPALACFDEARGLVPWLGDEEAAREAQRSGLPLFGAPAEVVARVHDKAFAVTLAREERIEPAALRSCIRIFEPEELADAARFAREVEATCLAWPEALALGGFTLKPRRGTSGRGRVGGPVHGFDAAAVRGGAARSARRGGAILEPWLARECDLSVVAWISAPEAAAGGPPITLLAALEQIVSESGLWLGHRGEIDRRGRIYSGTPWDDDMREAAATAAHAAQRAGHLGPCGIDGFSYIDATRDPARDGANNAARDEPRMEASKSARDEPRMETSGSDGAARRVRLRALIELNARFTLGHVCAGWLRRVHAQVVAQAELAPGRRMSFLFALAAPRHDPGWPERVRNAGVIGFDLATGSPSAGPVAVPGPGPFLLFHDDPERLAALGRRISGLDRLRVA